MKHRSLAHIDHDTVIGKGSDHAKSHDAGQLYKVSGKATEIIGTRGEHRHDILIDQFLWKCGSDHRCYGRRDDAGNDDDKGNRIIMKHISKYPVQQLCGCFYVKSGSLFFHNTVSSFLIQAG